MVNTAFKLSVIKKVIVFLLCFIYLTISFFPNTELSFVLIGVILILFTLFINKFQINSIFKYFTIFYTINFVISNVFWNQNYDKKDIISSLLFFSMIPVVYSSLAVEYRNNIQAAIITFWILLCLCICFWGIDNGIDFSRSMIFNLQNLHKNGVATFIEMGYVVALYSLGKKRYAKKIILLLLCFVSLLIVGSKTAILLVFFVTIVPINILIRLFFLLPIFLVILFFVTWINFEEIYDFLKGTDELFTASLRLVLWDKAISDVTESTKTLMFGIGPGSFDSTSLTIGDLSLVESPHNYVISIFNSYGIIGIGLFGFYFSKIFIKSRFKNYYIDFFFLAYILFFFHSLFDVGWVKGAGFFIAMITGLMFNNNIQNAKDIIRK
ncbi:MAG: O-antigen ligase family protein [Flavobacterium sp.]|jgi:hypothetical protein|nr:O-antigen ligase family protein [Flavobacterium sp.]